MVFINFSGIILSPGAYAVSAVVLLPINSALNPILYFDTFEFIYAHFKKNTKKDYKRQTITRQSLTGTGTTRL